MKPKSAVFIRALLLIGVFGLIALSQPSFANHNDDGARSDPDHVETLRLLLEGPPYVDEESTPSEERERYWIPSFQSWTRSVVTGMMNQILAIGMMLDAQNQMGAQLTFQRLAAQAHKDYHPDTQMCRFGTNIRALAASQARIRTNARALSAVLMQRDRLAGNTSTSKGPTEDFRARIDQFKRIYCDINDLDGGLEAMCRKATILPARVNKDINYTQTIDLNNTLDIDYTDNNKTADEEDVESLARNIFNPYPFKPISSETLGKEYAQEDLQDMRSLQAMRSVIYDSFSQIVGMRVQGTGKGVEFMRNFLIEMGLDKDEAKKFLGDSPSYFAQMDILTHKIYEDPVFYSNLYTKPENVERIGVSMQAIRLMQDRDRYEAALRREMLVSLLLELRVRDLQAGMTGGILSGEGMIIPAPPL